MTPTTHFLKSLATIILQAAIGLILIGAISHVWSP